MLDELFAKIILFFYKVRMKIGGAKITDYGLCLLNYCRKIVNNEWTENDRVEEYENRLEQAVIRGREAGIEDFTREDAAEDICDVLGALKDVS